MSIYKHFIVDILHYSYFKIVYMREFIDNYIVYICKFTNVNCND